MRLWTLFIIVFVCTDSAFAGICKSSDDFSSLDAVKATVRRIIETGGITGWDDKLLNRSGDMAALAIVKTMPDAELTKPDKSERVLDVLRLSFSCLDRCVKSCSDQEPQLTLLLLDHLRENSKGPLRAKIEETRKFVIQESDRLWLDSPAQ